MILLVQYTKIAFITFFSFFLIMHYQRVVIVLKANASGILKKKRLFSNKPIVSILLLINQHIS